MIKKWGRWIDRETTLQVKDICYNGCVGRNYTKTFFDTEEGQRIYISKKSVRGNGNGGLVLVLDTTPKKRLNSSRTQGYRESTYFF